MKRSKSITLVLITAALASCYKNKPNNDWSAGERHVYMRSDTSAGYSHPRHRVGLWLVAFRPYGVYRLGRYSSSGYYSDALSRSSNVGHNSMKLASVSRGGLGTGSLSVSS